MSKKKKSGQNWSLWQIIIIPIVVALIGILPFWLKNDNTVELEPKSPEEEVSLITFDLIGFVSQDSEQVSEIRIEEFPLAKVNLDKDGRFVANKLELPVGKHVLHLLFITSDRAEIGKLIEVKIESKSTQVNAGEFSVTKK